jgi:hypothetical protein
MALQEIVIRSQGDIIDLINRGVFYFFPAAPAEPVAGHHAARARERAAHRTDRVPAHQVGLDPQ